jgi:hypothetical protein
VPAAGIGRATLYKYSPDIESVLLAWHEGHADEEPASPPASLGRITLADLAARSRER